MEIFNGILILSYVIFLLHFLFSKTKSTYRFVELFLLYQLVFNIGILGILSFIGLTFMQERVASYLEWPTCPFQQELGNANLGFGVIGILCIWIRKHFWTATVISTSIWLFGDGMGHIYENIFNGNKSAGNNGILLFSDIFIPVTLVVLLCLKLYLEKKKNHTFKN